MSTVFLALYSDGPESGLCPISVHKTRAGAEDSVRGHKAMRRAEWNEFDAEFKRRFPFSDEHGTGFECWDVQEFGVQP